MTAARTPTDAASVDFALIGHQESWPRIESIVRGLRAADLPPVPSGELREMVRWIPPRAVLRSRVSSTVPGHATTGIYVETFITPDELDAGALHRVIGKVRDAIQCAGREGARIAALGGFTSIVLEGRSDAAGAPPGLALTTGNALTSAFIVQGVQRAAGLLGIDLREATLCVVGSTGDVGSACARYLGPAVKRLALTARNGERLRRQEAAFRAAGVDAVACLDVRAALARADVIVTAASLARPDLDLEACRPGALVCDAGYPKNVRASDDGAKRRVFWGGMGEVLGGWDQERGGRLQAYYAFPTARVAHGCLLEAVALSLAGRFEPFSQGRGLITPRRMDEIAALASAHGVVLAPLFGADGVWPEEVARRRSTP